MIAAASLGTALAAAYRTWAARLGVPIAEVAVAVACAPGLVAVDVTVTSAAAEADVRRVIEVANGLDATLADLPPEIERRHRLNLTR